MPSIARPKNEEIVCYIRREAHQQNVSTIIKKPGSGAVVSNQSINIG
jgi:hypothetical protein